MKKRFIVGLAVALTASLFSVASFAEELQWTPIFKGVELTSFQEQDPLRQVVVARIDLTAPGVAIKTTPPHPDFAPEERETIRETTPGFLKSADLALAVNGAFYKPFGDRTITKPGDANLRGLAVCDGFVEPRPEDGFPSFVQKKDGSLEIRQFSDADDLSEVQLAISGPAVVLKDGKVLEQSDQAVHPRTAIGFSQDQKYLFLMAIDGRRPEYSVGAKLADVGADLLKAGAYEGLNLDGGGSTTMAARGENGAATILNWPINAISPDGLRFNGNGIGVTAEGAPLAKLGDVVTIHNTGEPVEWTPAYDGVDVASWIEYDEPLRKIFAARIDLTAPGVAIKTTKPHENFAFEERETYRQTTAQFLKESGLKVAINANFYSPFNAETIKQAGDANAHGLAVCDGFVESQPQKGFPSFIVKKDGTVEIREVAPEEDLSEIAQAVSGNRVVLKDGEVVAQTDKSVHPRTAVGYSQDKRYLYFVVIDGRQKDYSIGATYEDVASALKLCGAYEGLNLDGGGSTTMALQGDDGEPLVFNRPINGTPDRLRFNANSIGVTANGTLRAKLRDGRVSSKSNATKFVPEEKTAP